MSVTCEHCASLLTLSAPERDEIYVADGRLGSAAEVLEIVILYRVEQFGPVVPVSVFDQPDEALDVVDRSELGQQASVFGRDTPTLGRMVDHLTNLVCRVNLNTQCRRGPDVLPFTGRKDSAAGTLSIYDALRTFSIRSVVAVARRDEGLPGELGAASRFLAPPGA